jgi:hypothetical protein
MNQLLSVLFYTKHVKREFENLPGSGRFSALVHFTRVMQTQLSIQRPNVAYQARDPLICSFIQTISHYHC